MSRWRWLSGRRSAEYGAHPRARRKVNRLLTAILVDIPALQTKAGRERLLRDAGGPLLGNTAESDVARDHLMTIVDAARRTGALKSLRDALLEDQPDDIGAAWFDLAVTVLTTANGALSSRDMFALIGELRLSPQEFGQGAISAFTSERRAAGRPLDIGSLPQVLMRLYDAQENVAERLTDIRRFLRLLSKEPVEQGQGDGLAGLFERVLGRDAVGAAPAPVCLVGLADAERQVIIQVRVEEEGPPSNLPYTRRRYSMRGFYYERTGYAQPVFRGTRPASGVFTGDELERHGREFLATWREPMEAGRDVSKRVEFLLPHSLLGLPAELWPGGPNGVPLSRSCQVVVRSLPRYQDSSIHREWIRRWERLDRDCLPGNALDRIGWMGPCATEDEVNSPTTQGNWPVGKYPPLRLTDSGEVEDWLRNNADLACVGLGTAYDDHDPLIREAVCAALLEDGIPVMVWRRDMGDPCLLLAALRESEPPSLLADLPHSVHQARRRDRADKLALSHHITLLWDDPTCVHSDQDHQMTGTRGAGEGAA